jgi:ADP-ribose pyrophosphatase
VLVQHPDSVVIVALAGVEIVLVRQARPGAPDPTLELPSGKVEPGESVSAAAARELAEECGLAAAVWREHGAFWAVPAYSTERVHVFSADGLSGADRVQADHDEAISVERAPADAALLLVSDAVSIAALALWRERQ